MKENCFPPKKARSRRYLSETITDADFSVNLTLYANTFDQAEFLQHGLEKSATGIGLYVKSDKTEFMCFKQDGAIFTLNNKPLKLDHLAR